MNIRFTLRDALAAAVDSLCILAAIIVMVPAAALLVGLLAWVLCNDQVVP